MTRRSILTTRMLVVVFTMDGAPTPLIVLRSSSALFMTKWITLSLPSHECSGLRRPHVGLDRSPYLLSGCSRMGTATERTLTTPQHSGPGTQNFTISSICRVLRALERPPMKDLKELFIVPPQNSFFEALLYGKSRCSASILPSSANMVPSPFLGRPAISLPKKLFQNLTIQLRIIRIDMSWLSAHC